MSIQITDLTPEEIELNLPQLVALFQDAVASGASLGHLHPLTAERAEAFWRRVQKTAQAGELALFVGRSTASQEILGTVQLALAQQPNGRHRAEVAKLMVHRQARRQGIGLALMLALEAKAADLGRTTLVLDTRQGEVSEQLYQALQYQVAGIIPEYAQSHDGTLHSTVIYYKLLSS